MPQTTDWARLAAFIDGEGSILISRRKPSRGYKNPIYNLVVSVSGTNHRLADWLESIFEGRAYWYPPYAHQTKPAFRWEVNSNRALPILEGAMPFLIIKEAQAKLALEYKQTVPSGWVYSTRGRPAEHVALQEGFYLAMRQMQREV